MLPRIDEIACYTWMMTMVFVAILFIYRCDRSPIESNGDRGIVIDKPSAPEIDGQPSWSPDGRTIAFFHHGVISYDPVANQTEHDRDSIGIWFISPDGSDKSMFLNGGSWPDWSPDGEWLVSNYGQIHKIALNGDSLVQLTFQGRNAFPSWSPNGEWIAYANSNCRSAVEPAASDSCGILIVRKDGSETRFITPGQYPEWSPDGHTIIFVHSEISTVNLDDTSEVLQLTSFHHSYTYGDLRYPEYSPDGSKIAFASGISESFGIWIMDSDGTNLSRLKDSGVEFSWSPDGEQIVYTGPGATLWIMNSDGSNRTQLTFKPGPR